MAREANFEFQRRFSLGFATLRVSNWRENVHRVAEMVRSVWAVFANHSAVEPRVFSRPLREAHERRESRAAALWHYETRARVRHEASRSRLVRQLDQGRGEVLHSRT